MSPEFEEWLETIKKRHLNIDNNWRCNLKCSLCQRQVKDKKLKETLIKQYEMSDDMSISDWLKIQDFTDYITLCGEKSDPIMHKNFYELLKNLKPTVKSVHINTACNPPNKAGLDWYRHAYEICAKEKDKFTWIFGFDGSPLSGSSSKYRTNQNTDLIWEAMKLGPKYGIKTVWQFIVFPYNEHEIEECISLAKENNLKFNKVTSYRGASKNFKPKLTEIIV